MARDAAILIEFAQGGMLRETFVERAGAPRRKNTSAGEVLQVDLTGDGRKLACHCLDPAGVAFKEAARVGMETPLKDVRRISLFNNFTGVKHDHVITEFCDDA